MENKGKIFGMTRDQALLFSCVLLALLLPSLDQTIVAVAMPTIAAELGNISLYPWVSTAYMIALAVSCGISGKLGDMFGRKKIYIIGILIFTIGSALCGLSESMGMLILFRAFQGIGGGIMMVSTIAIVGEIFPPAERGKYQGFLGAVFAVSAILGPALGALIVSSFGWRWVFYVNVPVAIVVLALLCCAKYSNAKRQKHALDWRGSLYFTLFILCLMAYLGSNPLDFGARHLLLLLFCAIFLALFCKEERNASEPILEPSLFKNRTFTLAIAASFAITASLFGMITSLPMLLQGALGETATQASRTITLLMLAFILTSAAGGWAISLTGKYRKLGIASCIAGSIGMLMIALAGRMQSGELIDASAILIGLGLGPLMPLLTVVVQNSFTKAKLGMVSSALSFFRTLGGALGSALAGVALGGMASSLQLGISLVFSLSFLLSLFPIAFIYLMEEKPLKKKW